VTALDIPADDLASPSSSLAKKGAPVGVRAMMSSACRTLVWYWWLKEILMFGNLCWKISWWFYPAAGIQILISLSLLKRAGVKLYDIPVKGPHQQMTIYKHNL
jgi:hypothetical protein